MAKITSHDVARAAGVSRATVSIVLSGSDAAVISAETRERVRRAAQELGYQPNSAARMLKNGATRTIGLLISGSNLLKVDAFIPVLFGAVCDVMRARGYHVLIETRPEGTGANPYRDLVQSQRIDGLLILNGPSQDPYLVELIESGFPAVLLGNVRHPKSHSVHIRGRPALMATVDRLVAAGHRDFGVVTLSPLGLEAADRRVQAVTDALAAHGLSLRPEAIQSGNFSAESGHAAMTRLLAVAPETTAVFAGNDTVALGVLGACGAAGRVVPRDISVIGFDDLPFAAHLWPPLTTIHVDASRQGTEAAKMLLQLLDGKTPPERQIALTAEPVWRGSDGPAPAKGQ